MSTALVKLWLSDGRTFDVRRFVVRESLGALWNIQVDVVSNEADIAVERLIDRGAAFALERPDAATRTRIWSGICTSITHVSADDVSQYRFAIHSEIWRLGVGRNSRVFLDKSLLEVVLDVFGEWGHATPGNLILRNLSVGDLQRFPKRELCVQYEESDLAFVLRLLEEAGVTLYFDYANEFPSREGQTAARLLTKVVLDGEPQQATETRSDSNAKAVVPLTYEGHQEGATFGTYDAALNVSMTRAVAPGAVTLIDHDFRLATAPRPFEEKSIPTSEGLYESFAYVPGLLQRQVDAHRGNEAVKDSSNARAADELLAERVFSSRVEFFTNALQVCPGSVVMLDDARGELRAEVAEWPHLVLETMIRGDTSGKWFVGCAAVSAQNAFRPPKLTPKSRIWGLQSAVVVGPASLPEEAIHCDDHGRVRVQFHWDRVHEFGHPVDADDGGLLGSCWVRVGTPAAGAGYGFVAIPRPGQEVAVAFLDGDPDCPVIVRCFHNDDHPPPFSPEREPTISGLRSCSSPGGVGYNEISFDDKKDEETLRRQAQGAMVEVVKAAETRSAGTTRTTKIGANDTLHIGDDWKLVAGDSQNGVWAKSNNELFAQVGRENGSKVLLTGNAIYFYATGDIHMHCGALMHFGALGNVDLASGICDINPPTRKPVAVSLPGFEKAQAPDPGGTIGAGPKPVPRGEMREPDRSPPRELLADVDFAPPPRTDRHDGHDLGDGHSDLHVRALDADEMTYAERLAYAKANPPQPPAEAEAVVMSHYGKYIPASADRGNHAAKVRTVADEQEWDKLAKEAGYKKGEEAAGFYVMASGNPAIPPGTIMLGPQAARGASVHELIHSYESPQFSKFMSKEGLGAGSGCDTLAEGTTEILTKRTGVHRPDAPTIYSPIVGEMDRINLSTDALAQAQFAGKTDALAGEIRAATGQSVGEFCKTLDEKGLAYAKEILAKDKARAGAGGP